MEVIFEKLYLYVRYDCRLLRRMIPKRNYGSLLWKVPWFAAESAVVCCGKCRGFLRKVPWFAAESAVVSFAYWRI